MALTIDYERTSLKPYVDMLERHARSITADVKASQLALKQEVKEESMEF